MATATAAPQRRRSPTEPATKWGVPHFRIVHWAFAGPAAALFVFFFAYPLGASLYQSFTSDDGGVQTWAGLAQYRRMLHDPVFWKSLWNTGLLLVFQVPLMIGLALVLACVLNQSWLRFKGTWRIAVLPAVGHDAGRLRGRLPGPAQDRRRHGQPGPRLVRGEPGGLAEQPGVGAGGR